MSYASLVEEVTNIVGNLGESYWRGPGGETLKEFLSDFGDVTSVFDAQFEEDPVAASAGAVAGIIAGAAMGALMAPAAAEIAASLGASMGLNALGEAVLSAVLSSTAEQVASSTGNTFATTAVQQGLPDLMEFLKAMQSLPDALAGNNGGWGRDGDSGGGGLGGGGAANGAGPFGGGKHDPLVIDVAGNGLQLSGLSFVSPFFNWNGTDFSNRTGWVGAGTGFLAIDANNDGQISADEMFGSSAQDGFTALAALDSNSDSVIDSSDSEFSSLKVWQDANANGVVDAGELSSLTDLGITSIGLTTSNSNTITNGNTVGEIGTVTHSDGSHSEVADVQLAYSSAYTSYTGSIDISSDAAALPEIDGYGQLLDLQRAMSVDSTLLSQVQDLLTTSPTDAGAFNSAIESILYRWSGADSISAISRGTLFDAQKLKFLESFLGQSFAYHGADNPFFSGQGVLLDNSWEEIFQSTKARFLVQDSSSPFFGLFSIDQSSDQIVPNSDYTSTVQSVASQAPTDASSAQIYWTDALTVINAAMSDLGPFREAIGAAVSNALAAAAPSGFSSEVLAAAAYGKLTYVDVSPVNAAVSASNIVYGTGGTDLFDVTAPDMRIVGRGGNDEFLVGNGVGHLEIDQPTNTSGFVEVSGGTVSQNDDGVLYFKSGISPSDVTVAATPSADLTLSWGTAGDQITIERGIFASQSSIQKIVFSDGTTWLPDDLLSALATSGTSGNDVLDGTPGADTLDGHGGTDLAIGQGGGDTFIFNAGYGHLGIFEDGSSTQPNTLAFGEGISPNDIVVTSDSRNFVLSIGSSGDQVTLDDMFVRKDAGVQRITFADGTVWSYQDLINRMLRGSTSDDTIVGTSAGDILDGGGGNDVITGGGGNDAFLFNLGYGHLEISETDFNPDANNTLLLGTGIAPSDVDVSGVKTATGRDIVLTIGQTGDRITLDNMLSQSAAGVQSIGFSDGTVWSRQDIINFATAGTSANDNLYGTDGADTLQGNGGNDYATGFGGNDTYVFNRGDGTLTIDDGSNLESARNVLKFGDGIDPSDVHVFGEWGSPIALQVDGGGLVILKNGITTEHGEFPTDIQLIEFADGTTWNAWEILEKISGEYVTGASHSTPGSDLIDGKSAGASDAGKGGGDTYVFNRGYGTLLINETDNSSNPMNILQFGGDITPSDVMAGQSSGGMQLAVGSNGDRVILENFTQGPAYGVQEVRFADGTVWTRQDLLNFYTTGTAGDDTVVGTWGADKFDGKGGTDSEQGNGGNDTFIFNAGYGQLTINEEDGAAAPNNVLQFGTGISSTDVQVTTDGGSITLTVGTNGDEVNLLNMFANSNWGVQSVQFADGTSWSRQDILNQIAASGITVAGTTDSDNLDGTFGGDMFDGLGGSDYENGRGGGDTFVFNSGYGQLEISEYDQNPNANNVLQLGSGIASPDVHVAGASGGNIVLTIGSNGDQVTIDGMLADSNTGVQQVHFADGTTWSRADVLAQVPSPIVITGTVGDDELDGTANAETFDGAGGSDQEIGEGGNDTFVFNPGYDQLEIFEHDEAPNANNTLQFGVGIAPADVQVSGDANGNVILTVGSAGDQVTIDSMLSDNFTGLQHIAFADGTIWSRSDVLAQLAPIAVNGTTDQDWLTGTLASDIFDGQGGTDYEEGEGGNDTFVFNSGYGQLEINEVDAAQNPDNLLQLGAGISPTDLVVTAVGRTTNEGEGPFVHLDLVVRDGVTGDKITLDDILSNSTSGVQEVVFADGTHWTRQQLIAQELQGTAASQNLYGSGAGETIDGGGGSDVVQGGGGGDTFVFNAGYGHLEISETDTAASPDNTLQLGSGINASNVAVSNNGPDIVLTIGSSGDVVTLDNMLGTGPLTNGVQAVSFADGTSWSRSDLVAKATIGTTGGNTLFGTIGVDTIDGKGGSDTVYGEGGGDTFVFNSGYGVLQINESDLSTSPNNNLQFGPGIAAPDVQISKDIFDDVVLSIGSSGDTVKILDMLDAKTNGIQTVSFADGTTWSRRDLLNALVTGTPPGSFDNLTGTTEAETFDGLGGDDIYKGKGGDDLYLYDTVTGNQANSLEIDNRGPDTAAHGTLQFASGITKDDLWFSREAGNLKVTVLGSVNSSLGADNTVTVDNWFDGDASAQLSEIELSDGSKLDTQLNQLINAMATYRHDNPSFDLVSVTQMPTDTALQNTIAASWHA